VELLLQYDDLKQQQQQQPIKNNIDEDTSKVSRRRISNVYVSRVSPSNLSYVLY
jgi:hypothetical protein